MLIFLALILYLTACGAAPPGPPRVTFYHWQTELDPSLAGRRLLDSFGCDRLYVKAFDLDRRAGETRLSARLRFGDTTGLPELVPVVFLTNAVVAALDEAGVPGLAERIVAEVEGIFPAGFAELQLDCDWTAGTRVRYFALLWAVRERLGDRALSCTVRLHQYRDRAAQGIPPADRGVLMAYNTGNLDDPRTENSIYDSTAVKAYLAGQPPYPLDLDLAVAVYDWAAVYRRDRLAYLVNEPDLAQLADTARFTPLDAAGLRYRVRQGTYLYGTYLYADDLIRREVVPPASLDRQAELLRRYVRPYPGQRVLVFRLGSRLWAE